MISQEEVKHIAELARIGLSEEEVEKYAKELSGILDWMKELQSVDTEGVLPTDHIVGMKNISRPDSGQDFENKEGIRKLFPERRDDYDKVKSVL